MAGPEVSNRGDPEEALRSDERRPLSAEVEEVVQAEFGPHTDPPDPWDGDR